MSIVSVRAALSTKLNGMTPALSTAWENVPFTPVTGTPYQSAFVLPSVENPTMGDDYHRLIGIFQVSLKYPLNAGTATSEARAELIKTTFKRGTSMTSGAVTVIVEKTPEISQGRAEDDRWVIPIKIRWFASIN
jgi:hypothetical protein